MNIKNEFTLLDRRLLNVLRELGYSEPTQIQKKAIRKILDHPFSNYLIIAPTGSGKTEAVILPILTLYGKGFLNVEEGIHVLYITPLRALNRDLLMRLTKYVKTLDFTVEVRHGDTEQKDRRRQSRKPPFMLITTPESLQAILWGKNLRRKLRTLRYVILDEIHSLIDNKRGCQLTIALERLRLLADFYIIGLSATISDPEKVLNFMTGGRGGSIITMKGSKRYKLLLDASKAYLQPSQQSLLGFRWAIDLEDLVKRIVNYVKRAKKTIIFVNTRDLAEIISLLMHKYADFRFGVHHGSLSKEVRMHVERDFKFGTLKAIIATSSLELGIDIGDADLVIQIMSPRTVRTATQRFGRAGHKLTEASKGILIATNPDDLYESWAIIKLIERGRLDETIFVSKCYDVLAHQVVGICRDFLLDGKEYPSIDDVFNIVSRAYPFRNLSKTEFNWLLGFMENRARLINVRDKRIFLRRNSIKYYFSRLSTIPSTIKYDVFDVSENKIIGELDEKFVLKTKAGDSIILAGAPRIVIEIDNERRLVRVIPSLRESKPPRWVGELMPTSYVVAQEVGRIRKHWDNNLAFRDLVEEINATEDAKMLIYKIREMYTKDIIPDDKTLLVEIDARVGLVVLHANFGLRINKTIALLLTKILSDNENFPLVGTDVDAYRIYLLVYQSLFSSNRDLMKAVEDALNRLIDLSLDESAFRVFLFQSIQENAKEDLVWYFIQVLRRFGLITSESSLSFTGALMLLSKYIGTPVQVEALNEYALNNLDIDGTINVLRKIDRDRIQIFFSFGLSKLAIQSPLAPIFSSENIEELILEKYAERLRNRKMLYICLTCGYTEKRYAYEILDRCPKCGSERITIAKVSDNKTLEVIKKSIRGERLEPKEFDRLKYIESYTRFLKYWKEKASLALAAYGIGHKQAIEILKQNPDFKTLLEELRKREINFWKNKDVWKAS